MVNAIPFSKRIITAPASDKDLPIDGVNGLPTHKWIAPRRGAGNDALHALRARGLGGRSLCNEDLRPRGNPERLGS